MHRKPRPAFVSNKLYTYILPKDVRLFQLGGRLKDMIDFVGDIKVVKKKSRNLNS